MTSDSVSSNVCLEFEYEDPGRATRIERSVRQEVGEIAGDRTRATIDRDGHIIEIQIEAADLVALRAGLNTWCTLIEVAERCSEG